MHRFAARKKFQKLYFIETYAIYRRFTTPLFTVFAYLILKTRFKKKSFYSY